MGTDKQALTTTHGQSPSIPYMHTNIFTNATVTFNSAM
jgi:hypothetical protein